MIFTDGQYGVDSKPESVMAYSQLGVEAISAACVEEHVDGLTIRVASNHTPTEITVAGLRDLLGLIRQGCDNSEFFFF